MVQNDAASRARLSADERALARMESDLDGLAQKRDQDMLRLAALEDEISQCRADIADLSAQRDLLKLSIARRRAALPPRTPPTMPDEILGMIFKHAIDGLDLGVDEYGLDIVAPKRTKQPFHFAAACKRWRSAALGMTSLWAYIGVRSISRGPGARHWVDTVRLMLQRSGTCGLEINVLIPHDELVYEYYQTILSEIMRHSSRWLRLTVACQAIMEKRHVENLGLLRARTPLLESVAFSFANSEVDWPDHLPEYLPYAPRLRSARFDNVPVAFERESQPGHNNNDTLSATALVLTECPFSMSRFESTVRSFPALTSLELTYDSCTRGGWTSGQTILIPELRALKVCLESDLDSDTHYQSFKSVLEAIDAPKLRALELPSTVLDDASPLIHRSAHTIRELRLRNGMLESARVLAVLVELRELVFDWTVVDGPFLVSVRRLHAHEPIWPKLERIVLEELRGECDDDELLRVLRERYPINAAAPAGCALLEVEIAKDNHLYGSVTAAEIQHILDVERQRRGVAH